MLLKFSAANCNSSSSSASPPRSFWYNLLCSSNNQPLTSQLNFSHSHFISAVTSYQSLLTPLLLPHLLPHRVCVFPDTWQVYEEFEEVLQEFYCKEKKIIKRLRKWEVNPTLPSLSLLAQLSSQCVYFCDLWKSFQCNDDKNIIFGNLFSLGNFFCCFWCCSVDIYCTRALIDARWFLIGRDFKSENVQQRETFNEISVDFWRSRCFVIALILMARVRYERKY